MIPWSLITHPELGVQELLAHRPTRTPLPARLRAGLFAPRCHEAGRCDADCVLWPTCRYDLTRGTIDSN